VNDNPVLYTALAYAHYGWYVFPCHPGRKTPVTPRGYLDATTDPDQVMEWFARHPDRNLAVVTGAPGPDVLDIDQRGPEGSGFPALSRLRAAGLLAGAAGQVRTPSGGRHVYFEGSNQRTGHLPACHVDFLAVGGYVLIPPSQVGGRPYQYQGLRNLSGHGQLDWHAAGRLLEPSREHRKVEARPPQAVGGQVGALARWVAAQREGNRNADLYWAANRALEADQATDLSLLAAAARQAGLDEREITRTLDSARRTTQASPEPPDRQAEGTS
jgi:hypothetical protein